MPGERATHAGHAVSLSRCHIPPCKLPSPAHADHIWQVENAAERAQRAQMRCPRRHFPAELIHGPCGSRALELASELDRTPTHGSQKIMRPQVAHAVRVETAGQPVWYQMATPDRQSCHYGCAGPMSPKWPPEDPHSPAPRWWRQGCEEVVLEDPDVVWAGPAVNIGGAAVMPELPLGSASFFPQRTRDQHIPSGAGMQLQGDCCWVRVGKEAHAPRATRTCSIDALHECLNPQHR